MAAHWVCVFLLDFLQLIFRIVHGRTLQNKRSNESIFMNSKLSINSAAKQTNTNRLLLFSFYQKGKLLCFDLYGCFQWIFIQSGSDIKTTTRTCTPSTRMLRWTKFVTTFLSLLPGSVCCLLDACNHGKSKRNRKNKVIAESCWKVQMEFSERLLCFIRFEMWIVRTQRKRVWYGRTDETERMTQQWQATVGVCGSYGR